MVTKGMELKDLPIGRVCETCELSKSHRQVNHKSQESPASPFDLVYGDVIGPITPTAPTGNRWILQLIDSHSRARWTHPMKTKGEAAARLIEFDSFVERSSGKKIKRIRLDGGKEFTTAINEVQKKGVVIEVTASYTPEQIGVAERANGTLAIRIRSMIHDGKLPQKLWQHTMDAAVYLLNRTSTMAINGLTPKGLVDQKLFNKDDYEGLDLSNLKVYGCRACVNIPAERRVTRAKFESGARIGKLIGCQSSRNYNIWIREQSRVITTCHVAFDESIIDDHSESQTLEGEDDTIDTDLTFTCSNNHNRLSETLPKPQADPADVINMLAERIDEAVAPPVDPQDQTTPTHVPQTTRAPQTTTPAAVGEASETDPRRSGRVTKPSERKRLADSHSLIAQMATAFVAAADTTATPSSFDPKTYREAVNSTSTPHWIKAMEGELQSLGKNINADRPIRRNRKL